MAAEQPNVQTERLRLRPFQLSDAGDVQALAGAREVAATTLNIPYPYEDGMAEAWISTHRSEFEAGTLATFAIIERTTEQLVGAMGLVINKEHERGELGYWVGVQYWNHGYATEAARAVVQYGFEQAGLHRIHASHLLGNTGSGRVMQKIGMGYEGRLRRHIKKWGSFVDIELYGVLRDEWSPTEVRGAGEPITPFG